MIEKSRSQIQILGKPQWSRKAATRSRFLVSRSQIYDLENP